MTKTDLFFQVPPAELEGLLLEHEDIADAGVIGIPDEVAGELPKAFVCPKPGKTIVPEDIVDWVASKCVHARFDT